MKASSRIGLSGQKEESSIRLSWLLRDGDVCIDSIDGNITTCWRDQLVMR
jgi:hypothetical protein